MQLKDYLQDKKMTCYEFSKNSGVEITCVQRMFKRKGTPSLKNVEKVHFATSGLVTYSDFLQSRE